MAPSRHNKTPLPGLILSLHPEKQGYSNQAASLLAANTMAKDTWLAASKPLGLPIA